MIRNPQLVGCTVATITAFKNYKPIIHDLDRIFDGLGTFPESLIEFAGRVCYRSTDNMGNAPDFIAARLREGHADIIEHGWLSLCVELPDPLKFFENTKYLYANPLADGRYLVSGNFRAWLENFSDHPDVRGEGSLVAPTIFSYGSTPFWVPVVPPDWLAGPPIEPRYAMLDTKDGPIPLQARVAMLAVNRHRETLTFGEMTPSETLNQKLRDLHQSATFMFDGISRACSHQLVRHRRASVSQESQRYVGLEKGGWQAIIPPSITQKPTAMVIMGDAWTHIERAYAELRDLGIRKEDARFLLPNATETRLVVTMSLADWKHFLLLRDDKAAQWEIRGIAGTVRKMLVESGLMDGDHDEQA